MTYIPQYRRWYCNRCQAYAPVERVITYQQPYAYYPPVPALPSEQAAKNKITGSFGLRRDSDKLISPIWSGIILALQVSWFITAVVGLILLILSLDDFLYDPYADLGFSNEALLLVAIAFILQISLTIFQAYLTYKLVQRRDDHFRRDWQFREGAIEYLGAKSIGMKLDLNVERWSMNSVHQDANIDERERSPLMWGLLVGLLSFIPFIGYILVLYVLHFVTKEQRIHEERQLAFNNQFQTGLMKTGVQTVPMNWMPMPRRSTALYMVLSVITIGFFFPYWWYVAITDMNSHIHNQWRFENQLMNNIHQEV